VFNFAAPGPVGTPPQNNSEHRFMLNVLRTNAKSAFTWLIVIGIVVVFAINFGPGSLSQSGCGGAAPPYAAKVNGRILPASDWERQYLQLYQLFQQQAGEGFTRELAGQLGLPAQAMEQIVDRELVIQEAKQRGLSVTSQELTRAVHAIPAFQENGVFRFEIYEQNARALYGSPGKFEAALKDDLLYQKMLSVLRETVKVSDAEVRDAFEADADRVALTFVRFPLAAAEAEVARPTDAEVKAFAEREAARVQTFHEANRARFDQPRKVRVRHVLARVGDGGEDAARKKVEDAASRAKKGEDFSKIVLALSEDENTKGRGGDLGFVSEGLFDEAFARAALALEAGQISEPVRSASGWHLIKAEEVVPARTIPLEAAREEIARELLVKDRARKLVEDRARAALDSARKGKKLAELFPAADAARKASRKPVTLGGEPLVAEETGTFSRGASALPKIGPAPGLLADALAAKRGEVLGEIYDTPAGPVIAAVTARETPEPTAFEAQREALETRLRNRKETEVLGAWLETLREDATIETNRDLAQGLVAAQG
jgi:peptidyl-prolyl cis-trans isomerase D